MAKLLQTKEGIKYPVTPMMLAETFPDTSFPENWEQLDMSEAGLVDVEPTCPPSFNHEREHLVEIDPELVKGTWQQRWEVREIPESELLNRSDIAGFWAEFISGPVYAALRTEAKTDLSVNLALTELIAAFSDAKAGHGNAQVLSSALNECLEATSITEADRSSFTKAMLDHRLGWIELATL